MGTKLNNAPVFYTVAQVQFNPILNLDSYVPAIQAKMREIHFPDFRQEGFQRIVISASGNDKGQAPQPMFLSDTRYQFGDMAGTSLFVLENNSFSFQTTSYDTFDRFLETCLSGLEIVHKAITLDFMERVGLRYLDAVQPSQEAGETLLTYLIPEVLGLALKNDGELQHSVSETLVNTSMGQLVSRVFIRHGNLGLPPELASLAPTINPRFMKGEMLHATLDTDAYTMNTREPFILSNIQKHLVSLHGEIEKAFKGTVTDQALAAWA